MKAFANCGLFLLVIFIATPSRGDTEASLDPPPTWEPERARTPFDPYDPGPTWDGPLTAEEQAVIDHGKTQSFSGIHGAFDVAVKQRAEEAKAEAAAIQLGLDSEQIGELP